MQGETGSVMGPPPDAGERRPSYDPDWYEKIERAMHAREIGQELQKSARNKNRRRRKARGLISAYIRLHSASCSAHSPLSSAASMT